MSGLRCKAPRWCCCSFAFGVRVSYDVTTVTFIVLPASSEVIPLHSWLMMAYKLPLEPSARRVYVWRKLKRLGAILLYDAVWALPNSARNREQFQWLAAEILEMGAEVAVWETRLLLLAGADESLAQQFRQQAEAAYREILAELEEPEPDLAALSRRYSQTKAQDYFASPLGLQVREALLNARGGTEA